MNAVKFKGGGHFLGIPARDLSEEEWAALDAPTRRALLASGLYEECAAAAVEAAPMAVEETLPAPKKKGG